MRRETVCFSMYSLMSTRTMASSSSKRKVARDLASSVLPTPVGPRKMKLPMGRLGSLRPARPRRMASERASMARSWPIMRSWRRSSIWRSFSDSPSSMRETGVPVMAPSGGLDLVVELVEAGLDLAEVGRHGLGVDDVLGGGLVDEVDGLVGQPAVADVAV